MPSTDRPSASEYALPSRTSSRTGRQEFPRWDDKGAAAIARAASGRERARSTRETLPSETVLRTETIAPPRLAAAAFHLSGAVVETLDTASVDPSTERFVRAA